MKLILNTLRKIWRNKRYLMIFIFFSSIFCSLIFLLFLRNISPVQHQVPGTDYLVYYEPIANSILQGKGITFDGKVLSYIAPGFPVFLSVIFAISKAIVIDKLFLVTVFNVFLTAFSCCLIFLIAKEVFNKRIALIASFLWMTYPFNLWFIKNPNTEVPFMLLFYLGIFISIISFKKRSPGLTFWGGFILGLASLVKLISLFFLPFLALLFFFLSDIPFRKIKGLLIIILLLGNLLAILPWFVYVFTKTGSFIPVSDLGNRSIVYGVTFLSFTGQGGDRAKIPNDIAALIERIKTENLNNLTEILYFFGKEIKNNPITVLKLILLKLARSWYGTSQAWWEDKILLIQGFYLVASFLGIIFGIRVYKDRIRDIILLLGIIFYFWAMTFLVVSILRYMIPVMSLVIIFSAVAINLLIGSLIRRFNLYSLCPKHSSR